MSLQRKRYFWNSLFRGVQRGSDGHFQAISSLKNQNSASSQIQRTQWS